MAYSGVINMQTQFPVDSERRYVQAYRPRSMRMGTAAHRQEEAMTEKSKGYERALLSAALAIAMQAPLSHDAAAVGYGGTAGNIENLEDVEFLTTLGPMTNSAAGAQGRTMAQTLTSTGCQLTSTGCQLTSTGCQLTSSGCQLTSTGCQLTSTGCQLTSSSCQLTSTSCDGNKGRTNR
jgi:hypothetical protein